MSCLPEYALNNYTSAAQIARIRTEAWVAEHVFCPSCGSSLKTTKSNTKACDFICSNCVEEFELKSKSSKIGAKIVNGAYNALIDRISAENNPNLFALHYNKNNLCVENFFIVPRQLFTKDIIVKRKPLSLNAKRAGWVGCNIEIGKIPDSAKIYYIKDSINIKRSDVLKAWKSVLFLRDETLKYQKNWLIETMICIDKIGSREFELSEIYNFEQYLKSKFPANNHIKEKIRQKLQILRDKGFLEFRGSGKYRLTN